MAQEGWTGAEAEAWLSAAGTATNYAGLYKTVREFQKPPIEELKSVAADFPETAKVSGLVEAMVEIDERWEHLQAMRAAGYRTPKHNPDITPANEAVILRELYREAQRLPEVLRHGSDIIGRLQSAEKEVGEAERLLHAFARDPESEVRGALDKTFQALGKSCSSCHRVFRDAAGKAYD